jgi:predicted RNA binding protein YcfA (HicA-like mRNA interferase family)
VAIWTLPWLTGPGNVAVAVSTTGEFVGDQSELPKRLSQKSAKKLLKSNGWVETLGGNHVVKMEKPGASRPITLPHHKGQDYAVGLTNQILKQAGLKGEPSESKEENA